MLLRKRESADCQASATRALFADREPKSRTHFLYYERRDFDPKIQTNMARICPTYCCCLWQGFNRNLLCRHVDADPSSFPAGPYVAKYGDYINGEPGCPLLVSLLLYLISDWDRSWDADTLFLDESTDTGVFVRPKRCCCISYFCG